MTARVQIRRELNFRKSTVSFSHTLPNSTEYSAYAVSRLIQDAFPHTESKPCTQSRLKHITGLERIQQATPDSEVLSSESQTSQSSSASTPQSNTVTDLLMEVQRLKERVCELEKRSQPVMCQEMESISGNVSSITEGPASLTLFQEFNLDSLTTDLKTQSPELYKLFMELGDTRRNAVDGKVTAEEIKATMSLCTLLNARSEKTKGIQLMMGMMLVARATSRQTITVLNHAGVCMSYPSIWTYMRKLVEDAQYTEKVQQGHWIWVYDNLNLHQTVRHERQEKHASMLNVTARLAVSIKNIPYWDVDWNDSTPQRPRSSLNCSHFLPTAEDAEALNNTATQYVMEFLVEHFDSLRDLKPVLPQRKPPHPVEKPTVAPMKILFRDEKYKTETIEIIRQLMEDAKLSGNAQYDDNITEKKIAVEKEDRTGPAFIDPTDVGLKKLTTSNWLRNQLEKTIVEDLEETDHGEIDVNYELHNV